jgi:hypothetical protein
MPCLLVRWWRWLTNPVPCPGDVWTLPGHGAVEVVQMSVYGDTIFRIRSGREMCCPTKRFLERALFGPPTASALIEGD